MGVIYDPLLRRLRIADTGGGGGAGIIPWVVKLKGEISTGLLASLPITSELNGLDVKELGATLAALPGTQQFELDLRLNGFETTDSIMSSDTPLDIDTDESATNDFYQVACSEDAATVGTTAARLATGETTLATGGVLHMYIVQVGSTTTGVDLTAQVNIG